MGAFYGLRIRAGIATLKEIPKFWQAAVKKWLKDNPENQER